MRVESRVLVYLVGRPPSSNRPVRCSRRVCPASIANIACVSRQNARAPRQASQAARALVDQVMLTWNTVTP